MTLQIPIVPAPHTGFKFEGVVQHQLRQALAAEIKDVCEALIASTSVSGWRETFHKFIAAIDPSEVRDPTRLPPYPCVGPNDARGVSNVGCVYARLSWILRLYWDLCLDEADNVAQIREYLMDLNRIVAHGIEKCRMQGNPATGYWLKIV